MAALLEKDLSYELLGCVRMSIVSAELMVEFILMLFFVYNAV